mmetsp:Transcript_10733/g.23303  ORF Transcript_10733/g.23303 Transcript_10733/m.23303 type:complete len:131 (-) Transcript_10733:96-488(-)
MLRGYLAKGWRRAIELTNVQNPEWKAQALLELTWTEVMEPIWGACNELMHGDESWYGNEERRKLLERIRWYARHRHEVLAHHDQFLAEVDLDRLSRISRKTQKRWARNRPGLCGLGEGDGSSTESAECDH